MSTYPRFKVAAVQMAPVMLDAAATTAKVCDKIREAGEADARVIGFPEAMIPGYPWWIWMGDPGWGMRYYTELFKNSLEIPGPEVRALSGVSRRGCVRLRLGDREGRWLALPHAALV